MYISDLALNDFRSYREVVLSFEPGVVTFVGENGQGKTNLVEAIAYLATFSSHRVAADAALVRQGKQAGVIRAKVGRGTSETVVELEIIAGRANRARINRGNARPSELLGIVRAVMFAPEDLVLIKGDPSDRRRFLDDLMVQFRPRLAAVKTEYEKVARQRGALLKSMAKVARRGGFVDETALEVWDAQLARLGAQIIAARAQMIYGLQPLVERYYTEVSGGRGVARVEYEPNIIKRWSDLGELPLYDDANLRDAHWVHEKMRELLPKWHATEIERGVNLVGPHRDEVALTLGTLPAKGYASHGETWSYALALRLASWQLLRTDDRWHEAEEPILILDDVFSELDGRRRERLASIVTQAEQVFVTAAVGEDLPVLSGMRFRVHDGVVKRLDRGDAERLDKDTAERPDRDDDAVLDVDRGAETPGIANPGDAEPDDANLSSAGELPDAELGTQ